jgi:cytochrome c-type biogenesis protein CcmH/NrfG
LLGASHAAVGDPASAVLSFQKALRLQPGQTEVSQG